VFPAGVPEAARPLPRSGLEPTPAPRPTPRRIEKSVERRTVISAKIFVGNLNFSTRKEELSELLSAVGEIKDVYLPSDRATGRPRGFAFVQFATEDEAREAIERFDGYELGGRKLRVNAAEERGAPRRPSADFFEPPPGFGPDRPGRGPGKPKGSRRGVRGKKRSL
jgi:RNA recognition motif-containing protein